MDKEMENNCSNQEKFIINLKYLPHIIPTFQSQEPKTRSLEKVVKPRHKEGKKLDEYDEAAPITEANPADTIQPFVEFTTKKENETRENRACQADSTDEEGPPKKGLARSHLYKICAANYWKPPLFECCEEEGPSHLKMFTFKVTVEIKDSSTTVLECFGAPQWKKKTAAEHAAEGALWYLKHIGYQINI